MLLAAANTLMPSNDDQEETPCRAPRSVWTRQWLLERPLYGQYEKLLTQLAAQDIASFKNFLRVSPEMFHQLVVRLTPYLQKQDTNMRKALPVGLRVAVTLRYLATGDSYKSLQYGFRVANNTICNFIPETCEAIIREFGDEFLKCPQTAAEWKKVAKGYQTRWNFPNTLGALDGKHIALRRPHHGGSVYYNYKGFHSIVLLALVDANYRFLYIDVGCNGSVSDGGVFRDTSLAKAIEAGTAGIPEDDPLPGTNQKMP